MMTSSSFLLATSPSSSLFQTSPSSKPRLCRQHLHLSQPPLYFSLFIFPSHMFFFIFYCRISAKSGALKTTKSDCNSSFEVLTAFFPYLPSPFPACNCLVCWGTFSRTGGFHVLVIHHTFRPLITCLQRLYQKKISPMSYDIDMEGYL